MKLKILSMCALMALTLASCAKSSEKELYEEIKSTDKMVFATMSITKMAKMESSDWYTIGKRIAVYSYDSYMRAYIDLSELQPGDIKVNDKDMTVSVTLPPVITEVTGRDMEMNREYENIGMLRSDLDSKERAEIKEKANASFKAEVEDNPAFKQHLIDAAQRKARKYFETLFEANGYTASIDFKTK